MGIDSMDLKIKIHNIGRLHKAEISVRPLTVLAGPNNTGKSFFSKSLYSLFDAMSVNPILMQIPYHLKILSRFLRDIEFYSDFFIYIRKNTKSSSAEKEGRSVSDLKKEYKNIEPQIHKAERSVRRLQKSCRFLNLYPSAGMFDSVKLDPEMTDNLNKTLESYRLLLPYFEDLLRSENKNLQLKQSEQIVEKEANSSNKTFESRQLLLPYFEDLLRSENKNLQSKWSEQIKVEKEYEVQFNRKIIKIEDSFNKMKKSLNFLEKIKNMTEGKGILDENTLAKAFGPAFEESLTANFQIANIKKLKNDEKALAFIEIENQGRITIREDNSISADLPLLKILSHRHNSRVLYIESPFFWKFRKALDLVASRDRLVFSGRRSLLTPKYFNDLSLFLLEELSGDPAFPEVLESIRQIVKGRLVMDEAGGLVFKESGAGGKSYSLPMTATGLVQMSILALLIEKKILDKDSVLFIDEPETNLHPAWQVKMMEVLFQLVKGGARIVIATHSADIMKWMEIHLENNPKDQNLIALNQLTLNENGLAETLNPDRDILKKIKSVKKNLTDPYLKLFLKGEE